jgi:hypothetical protein
MKLKISPSATRNYTLRRNYCNTLLLLLLLKSRGDSYPRSGIVVMCNTQMDSNSGTDKCFTSNNVSGWNSIPSQDKTEKDLGTVQHYAAA